VNGKPLPAGAGLVKLRRGLLRAVGAGVLVFLTVLGVRAYDAGNLPALEPWHRFVPGAEPRAAEMDGRFTLADYLRREDAAFRQVRDEVEARLPAAQRGGYNRFDPASPSSPERFPQDWNRTFELVPEHPERMRGGALLIHGLTDSPYSLRSLAGLFQRQGFYVLVLRLPGHGTVPAALAEATWEDWLAAVRMGARHVRGRIGAGRPLVLAGYSCGGALAVKYSLDARPGSGLPKPDRLVLLSPMIGVRRIVGVSRYLALPSVFPSFEKARWLEVVPEYNPFKYNSFPAAAAHEIYELTTLLQSQIRQAAGAGRSAEIPPILAFQSVVDATVTTEAVVDRLYGELPANGSELVMFDLNRQAELRPFLRTPDDELLARTFDPRRRRRYRATLVTNAGTGGAEVVERSIAAGAQTVVQRPLGLAWPPQVFSLSHIALPFPASDPVYGNGEGDPGMGAPRDRSLRLGTLSPRGERAVLTVPLENLMRISWNPFYPYLEARVREWIDR
jgi:alpha-beta hydrolase superfamily lysophospholipase